ncbi:hypothetical protein H0H92_002686 [Tricholoma furcatifolium]|nr:hypothetical protein H0H92_002686 [Tricholoma furcatifolium]
MDLASEPDTSNCEEAPRLKTKKPFPLLQLSIVWLIQFSEPVSNTVIYPFINQFVTETGITRGDETRTGYYAGIIESAFFLAETLSVYHWGRLSDRIGRRPVLLVAPLGLACSILLFGLSHSFWILVASRCGEDCDDRDPDDVPTAFGWIPAFWSIGITLGPIIGGVLARPASMPSILKHNANQKQRKSSMHASDIESTPLLASTIPEYGQPVSAAGEEHVDSAAPKPLPFTALLTRDVLVSSISMASIAFLDQSFGVLLPLMLSTSIPLGGLGFDPYTIGMAMGTWGLLNAGFQVIAFPTLFKWLRPTVHLGCSTSRVNRSREWTLPDSGFNYADSRTHLDFVALFVVHTETVAGRTPTTLLPPGLRNQSG